MSRSAYERWKQHRDGIPTIAGTEERRLLKVIREIHAKSDGTFGSLRVTGELRRRGWCVNHKRVGRLMRIWGIVGEAPKKKRTTTIPDRPHRIGDRVRGDFHPDTPDTTWCGDISYIPTWEGFS